MIIVFFSNVSLNKMFLFSRYFAMHEAPYLRDGTVTNAKIILINERTARLETNRSCTVMLAKRDSGVMFCLQSYQHLKSIDHFCINPIRRIGLIH